MIFMTTSASTWTARRMVVSDMLEAPCDRALSVNLPTGDKVSKYVVCIRGAKEW